VGDEKPVGAMRDPITVPKRRMQKAVLTFRTNDGREWVVAGAFAAAHPVGHNSVMMELEDLQALEPVVLGFSVVTDVPDQHPILDVTQPGRPALIGSDGVTPVLEFTESGMRALDGGTMVSEGCGQADCQHAPDGGNHPVVGQ
jgi:hypothetical protein